MHTLLVVLCIAEEKPGDDDSIICVCAHLNMGTYLKIPLLVHAGLLQYLVM